MQPAENGQPLPTCKLCGEPMPPGEEMFFYHGYSGPCPKPPKSQQAEAPERKLSYEAACHAMQSGVAFDQARGSQCGSPKHLRVGINAAMCDHAALVKLLISKGLITHDELMAAMTDQMNAEVQRYEKTLTERYGVQVKLG